MTSGLSLLASWLMQSVKQSEATMTLLEKKQLLQIADITLMFSFGFGGEPGGNRLNDSVPDAKKNKAQAWLRSEQALS